MRNFFSFMTPPPPQEPTNGSTPDHAIPLPPTQHEPFTVAPLPPVTNHSTPSGAPPTHWGAGQGEPLREWSPAEYLRMRRMREKYARSAHTEEEQRRRRLEFARFLRSGGYLNEDGRTRPNTAPEPDEGYE